MRRLVTFVTELHSFEAMLLEKRFIEHKRRTPLRSSALCCKTGTRAAAQRAAERHFAINDKREAGKERERQQRLMKKRS